MILKREFINYSRSSRHEENINYIQPAEIDVDNQMVIWRGACEICGAEIPEMYPYGYWKTVALVKK